MTTKRIQITKIILIARQKNKATTTTTTTCIEMSLRIKFSWRTISSGNSLQRQQQQQ